MTEKRKRRYHSIGKELARNSISAFLAGIELYNKPNLNYRNETVLIIVSHAWEILIKGILYKKNNTTVKKYIQNSLGPNGTSDIVGLKKVTVLYCTGKDKVLLKEHLDMLRNLRNRVMHAYILPNELEAVVWGLFQKSYELFNEVLIKEFKGLESDFDFPFILPIGIKQPYSKANFLSGLGKKEIPLINELFKSTQNLTSLGIDETIIVPLTFGYDKTSRVKNADIVIAIDPSSKKTLSFKKGIKLTHNAPILHTPIGPDELRKIFIYGTRETIKKYKLHHSTKNSEKYNIYKDLSNDNNFQIFWWQDPSSKKKLISQDGINEIERRISLLKE